MVNALEIEDLINEAEGWITTIMVDTANSAQSLQDAAEVRLPHHPLPTVRRDPGAAQGCSAPSRVLRPR
jgi:hypothetical protein